MPIQNLRSENGERVAPACSVNFTDNIVQAFGLGVCIAIIEVIEYLGVPICNGADKAVKGVTILVSICLHPFSILLFGFGSCFGKLIDISERLFEKVGSLKLRICFKKRIKLF